MKVCCKKIIIYWEIGNQDLRPLRYPQTGPPTKPAFGDKWSLGSGGPSEASVALTIQPPWCHVISRYVECRFQSPNVTMTVIPPLCLCLSLHFSSYCQMDITVSLLRLLHLCVRYPLRTCQLLQQFPSCHFCKPRLQSLIKDEFRSTLFTAISKMPSIEVGTLWILNKYFLNERTPHLGQLIECPTPDISIFVTKKAKLLG